MKITIKHNLTYEYSGEVSLDPHVIYLFPKVSECLILQNFKIEIYPKPSQIYQNVDLEGNIQTVAFFNQKTDRLVFDALINVQTLSFNTFDFVFFPFGASKLPFQYNEAELEILSPYLKKVGVTTLVDQVARKIAADSNWATTKFLMSLCNYIYQNFDYYIREEGLPQNPEYTLLQKAGSCRDYSVFFIACCRAIGLASRFVSGYYYSETLEKNYLHAWVEVYLPGGGWRAFDPTQNNAVSNLHIPLASSLFPEKIGPVTGTFRGASSSILTTDVQLIKANN